MAEQTDSKNPGTAESTSPDTLLPYGLPLDDMTHFLTVLDGVSPGHSGR